MEIGGPKGLDGLVSALTRSGYRILELDVGPRTEMLIEDLELEQPLPLLVYLATLGKESSRLGMRRTTVMPHGGARAERWGKQRTLLLGYAPDLDTYAAWQPEVHPGPAPGSSIRVSEGTLRDAAVEGVGVQVRRPFGPFRRAEIVTAFKPAEVRTYLEAAGQLERLRTDLEQSGPFAAGRVEEAASRVLGISGAASPEPSGAAPAAPPAPPAREEPALTAPGVAAKPEPPPEREVGTGFATPDDGEPIPGDQPLRPGKPYLFWFQVGKPVEHSIERTRTDLQLDLLPREAELTVALFGFEGELRLTPGQDQGRLQVGEDARVRVAAPVATPHVAPDLLSERLFLPVETPGEPGNHRLRCNLYCDGVLVQSRLVWVQVLPEGVIPAQPALVSDVEYSLSHSLHPGQLAALPSADLSLMVNGDDTLHQIRVYAAGDDPDHPFKEDATIEASKLETLIEYCRNGLRNVAWKTEEEWTDVDEPQYEKQPTDQKLRYDLAFLAIRGAMTYASLIDRLTGGKERRKELEIKMRPPGRVEIAAAPEQFVPAAMFYDAPIEGGVKLSDYSLCEEFSAARTRDATLESCRCFSGKCPNWEKKDVVCPSGFWGYRHSIGWPVSVEGGDALGFLPHTGSPRTGVGYALDLFDVGDHVAALERLLGPVSLVTDRDGLVEMLQAHDQQLVYLYCHGGATPGKAPFVRVGAKGAEALTLLELFTAGIEGAWSLVFLNGCRTTSVSPRQQFDLVSAFVEHGGALGVIGTEITVFEPMAARFGLAFLDRFMRQGATVGEAVRHARLDALKWGNPLGLVYVPFVLGGTSLQPPVRSAAAAAEAAG
jgi:hypothetical protein